MTQALSQPATLYSQWKTHLSEKNEKTHQEKALWWNTAQTVSVTALCTLGAAILLSPFVFPITYTNILMNTFALIPLLLPIPGYFYNYCVLQAAEAVKTCEKIIFFRSQHLKIENDVHTLDHVVEKTFEGHLSKEKKLLLEKAQEVHILILAHINFLTHEIQILEKKRQDLHLSLIAYKEQDLDDLFKIPLFSKWQDTIAQAKEHSNPLNFLQDLIKTLEKSSPNDSQAISELRNLHKEWHHKDSLTLTEKWTPLFLLDEKILTTHLSQLFLLTFLFLPEKELLSALKKHHLQIEDSLYDHKIKKHTLPLADFFIGKMYQDPSTEIVLLFPDGITLTKKEILDPKLKEQALDKFLSQQKIT